MVENTTSYLFNCYHTHTIGFHLPFYGIRIFNLWRREILKISGTFNGNVININGLRWISDLADIANAYLLHRHGPSSDQDLFSIVVNCNNRVKQVRNWNQCCLTYFIPDTFFFLYIGKPFSCFNSRASSGRCYANVTITGLVLQRLSALFCARTQTLTRPSYYSK